MQHASSADSRVGASFVPTRVLSVDIAAPLTAAFEPAVAGKEAARADGTSFGRAQVLVRVHTLPLGFVELDLADGRLRSDDLAAAIDAELGDRVREHLRSDGLDLAWRDLPTAGAAIDDAPCLAQRRAALRNAPPISIVVPTIDRPEALRRCLEAVLAQSGSVEALELIVVDNAPGESGGEAVVRALAGGRHPVRYEPEPRRGASRARNRGLEVATGEVVAFLDGDVLPDPTWLEAILAALATPLDGGAPPTCVTGAILPSDLGAEPQRWLEEWGGYAKGFERRRFDRHQHTTGSPLYPFAAGAFGSGANMAFRSADLRALGGFDVALGPGTPARSGEDIAAFVDVITSGGTIVYEPASIVWHEHPDTEARFRGTIGAYGTGLLAYLTRHASRRPVDAVRMAFAMPAAIVYFFGSSSKRNIRRSPRFPRGLWKVELSGMLQGPLAYALGRRAARRGRLAGPRQ